VAEWHSGRVACLVILHKEGGGRRIQGEGYAPSPGLRGCLPLVGVQDADSHRGGLDDRRCGHGQGHGGEGNLLRGSGSDLERSTAHGSTAQQRKGGEHGKMRTMQECSISCNILASGWARTGPAASLSAYCRRLSQGTVHTPRPQPLTEAVRRWGGDCAPPIPPFHTPFHPPPPSPLHTRPPPHLELQRVRAEGRGTGQAHPRAAQTPTPRASEAAPKEGRKKGRKEPEASRTAQQGQDSTLRSSKQGRCGERWQQRTAVCQANEAALTPYPAPRSWLSCCP